MCQEESRFPAERVEVILEVLRERGRVVAGALAAQFGVSEDSIRRDLRDLAARGLCRRVYGGAVLPTPHVPPFAERARKEDAGGAALAGLACTRLQPGNVVLLDAGTTNLAVARALPEGMGLRVITNAPAIALAAAARDGVTVHMLGGTLSPDAGGTLGAETLQQMQALRADVCLPGVCAVDTATGAWAVDAEESALKRAMIACSSRVFLLAGNAKLGAQGTFQIATLADIDDVFLEASAPDLHAAAFADAGIAVHRALP